METRSRWAENPPIFQATASRKLLKNYRFHASDFKQEDTRSFAITNSNEKMGWISRCSHSFCGVTRFLRCFRLRLEIWNMERGESRVWYNASILGVINFIKKATTLPIQLSCWNFGGEVFLETNYIGLRTAIQNRLPFATFDQKM